MKTKMFSNLTAGARPAASERSEHRREGDRLLRAPCAALGPRPCAAGGFFGGTDILTRPAGEFAAKRTRIPACAGTSLLLLLFVATVFAAPVTEQQARKAAETFILARYASAGPALAQTQAQTRRSAKSVRETVPLREDGTALGYVAALAPSGFVLLRADDQAPPVKLHSENGSFRNLPPAFLKVIKLELAEELAALEALRRQQRAADPRFPKQWSVLLGTTGDPLPSDPSPPSSGPGVYLLTTLWDQGDPDNYYCPAAVGGPGGRAPAGCAAIALAQILRYHTLPTCLAANHTYQDIWGACVGTHSMSDAGMGAYDWADMPDLVTPDSWGAEISAVGQLVYHCAVGFESDFEAGGTSADPSAAPNALRAFFGYTAGDLEWKSGYPSAQWYNKVVADIDADLPIFYAMWETGLTHGHSCVCDGYQNGNEIHLNLGWSGAGNAWYNLDTVAAGGFNWTEHGAVFGIAPPALPVITTQPQSLTVGVGSTATFQVTASGTPPLSYQWQMDGGELPGATGSTLTLTNVQLDQAANYAVVVTGVGGSVTSSPATLTVLSDAGPAIQWQASFGGSDYDELNSLQQTSDGGYILGGSSRSGVSGNKTSPNYGWDDFWVVKLDANGNKQWDRSFGGSSTDELYSLSQTSDGGYILGGTSLSGVSGNKTSPNYGNDDFWVVKLDANGNEQWDRSFGGFDDDDLRSLSQTSDGGYILGGTSSSGVSGNKTSPYYGNSDFWVVKLDPSGNKQWDRAFGGERDAVLYSLSQTSDDGYILGGESESGVWRNKTSPYYGNSDFWVVKLDANGNKQWDRSFGGTDEDDLYGLSQTSDGGFILGGESWSGVSGNKTSPNYGWADFWVVKLDPSGNKQWDRSFGGFSTDGLYSLSQTSDGGYILGGDSMSGVSGNKTSPNYGWDNFWVVKLDANGNKQWDKSFGGSDADGLYSLQQTSDGGYILGGTSYSGVSGNKTSPNYGKNDFWVVKLGPEGVGAPTIATQPQSWMAPLGSSATFTVTAAGDPPLTYHWRFNGSALSDGTWISGATSPSLTILDIQPQDQGLYTVVVENPVGAVVSTPPARLTVTVPPEITSQPGPVTTNQGATVSFRVVAAGQPPLGYRWRCNDIPLADGGRVSGATSACLWISSIQPSDEGSYNVVVSNAAGAVVSAPAGLTVVVPPAITQSPTNQTVPTGGNVTLTVTAAGTAPLSYQWQKDEVVLSDGGRISGAASAQLAISNVQAADTGSYVVVVTNAAGAVTSTPPAVLTVRVSPSITWPTPADITYGTPLSSVQLNATATVSGTSVPGTFAYSPAALTMLGAGNAQTLFVTFTPTDTTHYLPATALVSINVLKAPLTVTAGNVSRTYGNANLPFSATITGFVNGDTVAVVSGSASLNTAATAMSPIGPYPIVPTLGTLTAANYTFASFVDGTLTVAPSALTIRANDRSKTYGQSVTFVGTEFTTNGLLGSDTVTNVALTSAGAAAAATAAGSPYSIVPSSATGTGLGNYAINYQSAALAVSPAALTLTANGRSKTYGQSVTFAGTEFTTAGLQNSETVGTVTLTSSGAGPTATVAGSPYSIVPSAATGGTFNPANYTISYQLGAMTVGAASLTITANNRSKTYGQTVTFAGTEFTTAGLQNSETVGTVTLTSSGAGPTATVAGSPYSIVPSAASGGTFNPANYTLTYQNGTLTVTRAALTIMASSRSKTYGQTVTFAGTEFTTSGLQSGETVGSVTLTSSGAGPTVTVAGSPYSIVPSAASGGTFNPANYTISYQNGALTVTTAVLTVTADSKSRGYGAANPALTYTITGYQNGENATTAGVTGAPTLSTTATAISSVAGSPYPITCGVATLAAANYSFTATNGALTVTPAALTIAANNRSKTYGQTVTFAGTEFTAAGLQNSETVGTVTLTSSGAVTAAGVSGSPYSIVPSAASGGTFNPANYTLTYQNGTLTVTPAALTITASNRSKTYGQTVTFAGTEFTTSGLQSGETVGSVTLTSSSAVAAAGVSGSPYSIVPSAATGGTFNPANYTFTYQNGTLTVTPAALTITATNRSKTYGQTVTFAGTEFTAAGLQNGETVGTVTLTSSGAGPTATVAGSPYSIVPSGASGGTFNPANYTIGYQNGTLTVTQANIVISNPTIVGQTLSFTVPTVVGATYVLEYKNSLADASWTVALTLAGTGDVVTFTDDTTSSPARFYRVRVEYE